jgi:hypothetical protein
MNVYGRNLACVGQTNDDLMGLDRARAIAGVELRNGAEVAFICRGDGSDWALRVWLERPGEDGKQRQRDTR